MKSFFRILFRIGLLLCLAGFAVCFHEPLKAGFEALRVTAILHTEEAEQPIEEDAADIAETPDTAAAEKLSEQSGVYYVYAQLSVEEQAVYTRFLQCVGQMETSFEVSGIDAETLDAVYDAMMADHPELFWVSGYTVTSYMLGDVLQSLTVEPSYTCGMAQRDTYAAQIEEIAEEIVDKAAALYETDYGRVKYIFETLIHLVTYDTAAESNQTICSVFLQNRSVCMGYAKSFQYLLQKLGYTCVLVSGNAGGEAHAWDLVYMDGAYYYIDPTWGDTNYSDPEQNRDDINYVYFCMTTADLEITHESSVSFSLPDCTETADNYYVREGLLLNSFSADEVGSLIWDAQERGASEVTFRFTGKEAYEQAYAYLITNNRVFDYCVNTTNISYREDALYRVLTIYF